MAETVLLVGDSYSDPNIFYASHFQASDPYILLLRDGQSLLVTSDMEVGRARKESAATEVRGYEEYGYRELTRELGDRDLAYGALLARVVDGVPGPLTVGKIFPALYADALRQAGHEVQINPALFRAARRHKSAEQVAAIAQAQQAAARAVERAVEILAGSEPHDGILTYAGIPLTSERLRAEIEVTLTRDGMDTSHTPIVAGGPGAADPHWTGSGPLRAGESIVMDIFPRDRRSRYFGDLTRTVVRGEPSELLRRMYDSTLRAYQAAMDTIRAGVPAREVHTAAEQVFAADGFAADEGPRFIHSLGHGVGLDIHEGPNLSATSEVELEEGDIVTVEPGLYDPTVGAIRIEDTVLVTRGGARLLAESPKQFEL